MPRSRIDVASPAGRDAKQSSTVPNPNGMVPMKPAPISTRFPFSAAGAWLSFPPQPPRVDVNFTSEPFEATIYLDGVEPNQASRVGTSLTGLFATGRIVFSCIESVLCWQSAC